MWRTQPSLSIGDSRDTDYRKPPPPPREERRIKTHPRVSVRRRWLLLLHEALFYPRGCCSRVVRFDRSRSQRLIFFRRISKKRRGRLAGKREASRDYERVTGNFPDDTWNYECKCIFVGIDYTLEDVRRWNSSSISDLFNYESILRVCSIRGRWAFPCARMSVLFLRIAGNNSERKI